MIGFCFQSEGIANTRRGDGIGARHNGAIFVHHVHLCVVEDAGFVSVTFGHDDVSVGFDDVEGTLLDKVDHGFVKDELHRHEIVVLRIVEVLVHHTVKGRGEGVVITVCCVGTIGFRELPNEHGREIVLITSQKHVPCRRNAGLEVVRHRRVFARAQRLETVVPPRNESRSLRVAVVLILIGQPLVRRVPTLVVEGRPKAAEVSAAVVSAAVQNGEAQAVKAHDVRHNVVDAFVNFSFLSRRARDGRIQSVGRLLAKNHDHDKEHSGELWRPPHGFAGASDAV